MWRILLFVVLSVWYIRDCHAVPLSKRHVEYIASLIQTFTKTHGKVLNGVIHPPSTISTEYPPVPEEFLLPRVILWNPILTHSCVFTDYNQIQCMTCEKVCKTVYWHDGNSIHNQPRLIHDIDDIVLLVSAVYGCEEGHRFLAHDQRILNKLPCKAMVPFVLLHKTGFTNNFVNFCGSLCQTGMNFHSLEAVIGHRRWEYFISRKQLYLCSLQHCTSNKDTNHDCFPCFKKKDLPSDDIICKCFLSKFIEDESSYIREIQSVHPGHSLSFDHTFKIATNIGYVRADRKWVCQYNSAFLILNHDGKVVSWQFTKGTNFDEVKRLLQQILKRCQSQGSSIDTVYVDNCCHWRQRIREVFGSSVVVFLDVFHAVQRITRKIPKRHPFCASCSQDLRMVFRSLGDYGVKRTKSTPPPSELLQNLNLFTAKWKDVLYDEKHVLTRECIAEIEKLKVHINKGCLSGIPVGGGTNRNEAFHRYINTFFHKSRVGIFLAYALMMTIIHQWNTKDNQSRQPIFKPISLSATLSEQHSGELEKMGIIESEKNENDDNTWVQDEDKDITDIDSTSMDNIICVSLSQFRIFKMMKSNTKTATQLWKYMPYIQVLPDLCFQSQLQHLSDSAEVEAHKTRLKKNVSAWNFNLIPVLPNGNCFFTSISLALVQDINKSKPILDQIGVDVNETVSVLSSKLREVIVQEWLGPNRCEYVCFLTNEDIYEHNALLFLQDGHYDSELGNTMPLAMANALGVSLVILTSIPSSPVFYISPRSPTTDIVLYLAYTSLGSGHYDVLVLKEIDGLLDRDITKCRCGVNSKGNYVACNHQSGRHSSCRCLSKGQGCSSTCACRGCNNPNGRRPSEGILKRKREPHTWQLLNTSNKSFVLNSGQVLAQGAWSEFENMVFANILRYNQGENNAATIFSLFSAVVKHIHAPYFSFEIPEDAIVRPKSMKQIEGKLRHYLMEKSLFEKISQ